VRRTRARVARSPGRIVRPSGGEPLEEHCIVVCGRLGRSPTREEARTIGEVLAAAEANGWWFLGPGTAIAVFISRQGGWERAAECEALLRALGILSVARSEGPLTATFTAAMTIESMPVGEIVAEAVRRAM
jgi:hypothetical protein